MNTTFRDELRSYTYLQCHGCRLGVENFINRIMDAIDDHPARIVLLGVTSTAVLASTEAGHAMLGFITGSGLEAMKAAQTVVGESPVAQSATSLVGCATAIGWASIVGCGLLAGTAKASRAWDQLIKNLGRDPYYGDL